MLADQPVLRYLLANSDNSSASVNRSSVTRTARFARVRNSISCKVRAVILFLIVLVIYCHTPAANSAPPNYFTRYWQTTDGLPDNNVTSVIQTQDGYIWLGTRSGLARFDGVHATVFDGGNTPEMQSRHVTSLFEDAGGTLWIGHENGGVTSYKDGNFKAVPVEAIWRGGKILGINADAAGDVWLLYQSGDLARVKDGFVLATPSNTVVHLVSMTRKSGSGDFWIQRDAEVFLVRNGQLNPVGFGDVAPGRYVQGMCASRDGGLWVLMDGLVRKWKDGKWSEDRGMTPWGLAPAHYVIETQDGTLLAATVDFGLHFVFSSSDSKKFSRASGFSSDWVTSVCEDHEGNLWAGTGNGGLAMLRAVNVTTLTSPDQWQGRAVLSVAAGPGNALWIGTEGAGLYRFADGNWTNIDNLFGLSHRYIWSVTLDAHDHVWVGTWGAGIFAQNGAQFENPTELKDLSVAVLSELRDGGLCAGTSVGLLRYDGNKVTWLARNPDVFSADVRAITEGADGAIWFGMCGGGIGVFKEGKTRQFRRCDGLSSDFVQCLHLETDNTLWIGTSGGGINRLKNGHFVALNKSHGLPNDVICDIQDDELGFFWISSHGGVTRVSKAELDRCADGKESKLHCVTYGLSDGLATLECSGGSQPAGCKSADGRIWFATAKGLVGIDPHDVRTNQLKTPVLIENVRVDEHPIENIADRSRIIRIPPGRHRLDFAFTGLSFMAPERVNFKYYLENWDREWRDAGTDRFANYTYVPPGDYVFRVKACNNDGIWNEDGAALAFTVLPFFWQTWLFRVLVSFLAAAGVGGGVLLVTRHRMRQKLERIERQQALERERVRIAKDIHDDLGASLTRISLLTQSTRSELKNPEQAAIQLDRIYSTTRELTRAMDEIVWAVNPRHDTLDSLAGYLGKFAHDYLRAAGIRCKLDVPVQLPPWPLTAEVRHNVFLAFKEALHNIVKHAHASAVRIILTLDTDGFSLIIDDNGCGFNPEKVASEISADPDRVEHGNGLSNMKRRLAETGGHCEIQSALQFGTKVKLDVPVKAP